MVTNRRLVIQHKGIIQEDFDLKSVAHISTKQKANDLLGMICTLLGGVSVIYGLSNNDINFSGLGIFLIIIGVLIFRSVTNVLVINLTGVVKEFEYELKAPTPNVQRLISKIAEIRSLKQE